MVAIVKVFATLLSARILGSIMQGRSVQFYVVVVIRNVYPTSLVLNSHLGFATHQSIVSQARTCRRSLVIRSESVFPFLV